jgi:nucleotide-binding universal stress UspA family protein
MFEKAVIATDFSPLADRMVQHAAELTNWGVREMAVVHVIEHPVQAELAREVLDTQAKLLRERERQIRRRGVEVRGVVEMGPPGQAILKVCEREKPSLVVMGSHGHGIWKRALLGSTSDAVIRASKWPVLLVRLALLQGEPPERIFSSRAVLFPTDFSPNAAAVLRYLKRLPAIRRLTLLHVQEQTRIMPHLASQLEEFNRIDRLRLQVIRQELLEAGIPSVDTEIELGEASRVILDRAEKGRFTLIALGLRGRTVLDDIFIGSVADSLSRYARLPLLLIPGQAGPAARIGPRQG